MRVWITAVVLVAVWWTVECTQAESSKDQMVLNRQQRTPRGGKNRAAAVTECRYRKGQWGECSSVTNQKSRILTLKRGDESECELSKTETKKCKSLCKYQKGQWSECSGSPHKMERVDTLKPGSDGNCEATRRLTKNCKGNKAPKKSGKKSRNN